MKPETLTMIKSMLALDGTVSQEESTAIFEACKHPLTRSDTTTTVNHYLSLKEAAEQMHLSTRTVHRMIISGELSSVKIRRCRRVAQSVVQELLSGQDNYCRLKSTSGIPVPQQKDV
jgi:excisionase family DNA binding protein